MSLLSKLGLLRDVIRKHTNWVLYSLFGKDAISKEAYEELKKYKKLPMDEDVSLVERAYILGRLKSSLKSSEYKDITSKDLEQQLENAKFTKLEDLVIQQAKLSAADNVKGLMDDVASGVFAALSDSIGQKVSEATVKEIIRDEVVSALTRGEGHKKLASGLATRLQDKYSRDWERVAHTEIHAAKTKGFAQAIVNKIGVFAGSDGIDSKVSIVPNAGACGDCKSHYLDGRGNPNIFTLRKLISEGTNADPSISHARNKQGLHKNWKTTLPPLHPRCFCQIVYIPAGFSWKDGRLVISNSDEYKSGISSMKKAFFEVNTLNKANGVGNPTKVGQTEAATKAQKQPSQPGNIPGVAAPSQVGGGGAPASGGASPVDTGPQEGYSACIAGGGKQCLEADGNGAESHEIGGKEQQKHLAFFAKNPGSKRDKAALTAYESALKQQSEQWASVLRSVEESLDFMKNNEAVWADRLVEKVTGLSRGLERLYFKDGGIAQARIPFTRSEKYEKKLQAPKTGTSENKYGSGLRSVPHDQSHNHEVAAYDLSVMLFGTSSEAELILPTTYRELSHPDGPVKASVQSYNPKFSHSFEKPGLIDEVVPIVKSGYAENASPEDKAFSEKYRNAAVLSLIMGEADRHLGNVIFNDDLTDFRLIDHEYSFSNAFDESKNAMLSALAIKGVALRIPKSLEKRLENSSFSMYERSLGSHLQDWQVGQTYLRAQYLLYLQDTEGHIDPDKFGFRALSTSSDDQDKDSVVVHKDELIPDRHHFDLDPRSLFENFVEHWLDEHTQDKRDPLYVDAKRLRDLNVFMPRKAFYRDDERIPGLTISDHKQSRKDGAHHEYREQVVLPKKAGGFYAKSAITGDGYFVPPDIRLRRELLARYQDSMVLEEESTGESGETAETGKSPEEEAAELEKKAAELAKKQQAFSDHLDALRSTAHTAVLEVHAALDANPKLSKDALLAHRATADASRIKLTELLSWPPENKDEHREVSRELAQANTALVLIEQRLKDKKKHVTRSVKQGSKDSSTKLALLNKQLAEAKDSLSKLEAGSADHKKLKRDISTMKAQIRTVKRDVESEASSRKPSTSERTERPSRTAAPERERLSRTAAPERERPSRRRSSRTAAPERTSSTSASTRGKKAPAKAASKRPEKLAPPSMAQLASERNVAKKKIRTLRQNFEDAKSRLSEAKKQLKEAKSGSPVASQLKQRVRVLEQERIAAQKKAREIPRLEEKMKASRTSLVTYMSTDQGQKEIAKLRDEYRRAPLLARRSLRRDYGLASPTVPLTEVQRAEMASRSSESTGQSDRPDVAETGVTPEGTVTLGSSVASKFRPVPKEDVSRITAAIDSAPHLYATPEGTVKVTERAVPEGTVKVTDR